MLVRTAGGEVLFVFRLLDDFLQGLEVVSDRLVVAELRLEVFEVTLEFGVRRLLLDLEVAIARAALAGQKRGVPGPLRPLFVLGPAVLLDRLVLRSGPIVDLPAGQKDC